MNSVSIYFLYSIRSSSEVHAARSDEVRQRNCWNRKKSSRLSWPSGYNGLSQHLKKTKIIRKEWASALQGAGAEGQHRSTPTRAAAPAAPPQCSETALRDVRTGWLEAPTEKGNMSLTTCIRICGRTKQKFCALVMSP